MEASRSVTYVSSVVRKARLFGSFVYLFICFFFVLFVIICFVRLQAFVRASTPTTCSLLRLLVFFVCLLVCLLSFLLVVLCLFIFLFCLL